MIRGLLAATVLVPLLSFAQNGDSATVRRIYDYFLTGSSCYTNLHHLSTRIGGRLSGSPQAAQAVEWARRAMIDAGADTVFLQPCMVPHWVRGAREKCVLRAGRRKLDLACTALGSSVATPEKGITAGVVEVRSFEELSALGEEKIRGRIVFFNVFFDQRRINTGQAYGETVKYRGRGASQAARYGAVACLVRSMTSVADDEPHTGNMSYDTTLSPTKIPAVALGYLSADRLQQALRSGEKVSVFLKTSCQNLAPVRSYNVVGEIRGTRDRGLYLVAGAHLDSWDNGQGAHDDGAGIVQAIEVLAAFKKLSIRPLCNIRAVAFMNEENGLAGGSAYAGEARQKNETHLAAIESDAGGFVPRGFNADTARGLYRTVAGFRSLFEPYYCDRLEKEGGGADLMALEKLGTPCMGFIPDTQRYFDIHHTAADTFDKVNRRELELGGAAITSMLYLLDQRYRWE